MEGGRVIHFAGRLSASRIQSAGNGTQPVTGHSPSNARGFLLSTRMDMDGFAHGRTPAKGAAMTPEQMATIEQYARTAMMLSPLALLVFKSVREWLRRLTSWAWAPVAEQLAKRDQLLREMREDLGIVRQQMSVVVGTIRVQTDSNEDVGFFECDAGGKNTYVSATYARWMGATREDLMAWGFITFTHPEDRGPVLREWALCREQHRDYRGTPRMGPPGGPYRTFSVIVRPIPKAPPAVAWAGSIRPGHRRTDSHTDIDLPKRWQDEPKL